MSKVSRHLKLEEEQSEKAGQRAYYDKSWAIVVGISKYMDNFTRLPNARNDAKAVATILRNKYHFDEVHELYDEAATYEAIMAWLRDKLREHTRENDRVIFFFAGHGDTLDIESPDKPGYFVPYNAKFHTYADCIDMWELQRACRIIPAKHIFIILDCCFSGIAAVSGRAMPPLPPDKINDSYLQRLTKKGAWQVLTAGDSDDMVADGGVYPGHSIFTGVLLEGLEGNADQNRDDIFTATDLAAYVKPLVTGQSQSATGKSQAPFYNYFVGSGQGDFVFIVPQSNFGNYDEEKTVAFDWVKIPAGDFLMGSDKRKDLAALDEELPQESMYLPEYRIARVPVTNAQYKQFVDATDHKPPKHWQNGQIPKDKESHPVVNVTWYDSIAFCRWAGVRLPTEAEWEKAARGTDGRIWPWGNEPPDKERCNFNMNVGDTTPVDAYSKGDSPYGVLDMAGNVWEWTSSLNKAYPYNTNDDRENPASAVPRVLRSGSFDNNQDLVRCAYRDFNYPGGCYNRLGFRVVSSDS